MTNIFNMSNTFAVISTTVIGSSHSDDSKSNEDSFAYKFHDNFIVACVTDGCSSADNSAYAASFASNMLVSIIYDMLSELTVDELKTFSRQYLIEFARKKLLIEICKDVRKTNDAFSYVVKEEFVFTIVATIITEDRTDIFSIGDGYYYINGEMEEITTMKDKAFVNPHDIHFNPYPVYAFAEIMGSHDFIKETTRFQVLKSIDTKSIKTLMIGTDGVSGLLDKRVIEGSFGNISQLFTDEYFSEPNKITEKLEFESNKYPGILYDDLTMLLIKRKEN